VQKDADTMKARLAGLEYDLANVEVKAPVDGTVVGLAVFTRGGVVSPGFRMMDIVPKDDPLIVEGQVPVALIDKVHVGLPVVMIFAAFNQNQTPRIPGIVTQVDADRMVDEKTGQSFYKMKAQVAPKGQKLVSNLPVKPGMPVELFVQTGERTLLSYLFKPVLDRAHGALSED
jgi:protease secretion system membrane fusion protein